MKIKQLYPCIWFDNNAKIAADFYCSIFREGCILQETSITVSFKIAGTQFLGINGGQRYAPNPAISYFVYCGGESEIERLYMELSKDGKIMMPLGKYDWTEKYAWVEDRFGVSWQLDVDPINSAQGIVPCLFFGNEKYMMVKPAIEQYTQIFDDSRVLMEMGYPSGTEMPADALLFAQFKLDGFIFNAVSSPQKHEFDFSPGNSFVIVCYTQAQIEYYWEKLGEEGRFDECGWLTDRYGVSWQIIPAILPSLMTDSRIAEHVMNTLLQMQRLDILPLLKAQFLGISAITIECSINAPLEKVWRFWTSPEHISQWHQANEDWHCPQAENELFTDGKFSFTMASKDGKISFNFEGTYDLVIENQVLAYTLTDGRKVIVEFGALNDTTMITEMFEPEVTNSMDLQKSGWQSILDNFKKYVEKD